MGLPTIDCIRTSLHGFVEIEMDHTRFHLRSMSGSFSQMFMRQICFRHCYLADWIIQMSSILCTLRFTFRWAMIYTLWDLPFKIRRQSSFSDIESSSSLTFQRFVMMHQFLTYWFQRMIDLLVVLAVWAPWIPGHISLLELNSPTLVTLSIRLWAHFLPIHFRVGLLYLFLLGPEPHSPELSTPSRPWVL